MKFGDEMDLLDEVKILCVKNKTNLTKLTEKYNSTYGTKVSHQSMYRKLQTRTIKYDEMENMLKILNCVLDWKEVKE